MTILKHKNMKHRSMAIRFREAEVLGGNVFPTLWKQDLEFINWIGSFAEQNELTVMEALIAVAKDVFAEEQDTLNEGNICPPCNHDCNQGRDCPARRRDNG